MLTIAGNGVTTLAGPNAYHAGTVVSGGTVNTGGTGFGAGTVNLAAGTVVNVNANSGLTGVFYQNDPTLISAANNQGGSMAFMNTLSGIQSHFAALTPITVAQNNSVTNTGNFNLDPNGQGSGFPAIVRNTNGANYFEAIYTGAINITTSGTYTFGTDSDDGSMVYIDGNAVQNLNGFRGESGFPASTGSIALSAGQHQITIGYYQGTGGYGLKAGYQGPDTGNTMELIPNSVLTPDLYANSLTGAGNVNLAAASMYVGADNTNQTYSGNISGGFGGVTKVGTGTWTIAGASTYSGPTTVVTGKLQLGSAGALPAGPNTGSVSLYPSTTLDVNGQRAAMGALSGSGTVDNTAAGTASLSVGGNNGSATFSGIIQNSGGALTFVKAGSGTQLLTGANTYGGATLIQGGTLKIQGPGPGLLQGMLGGPSGGAWADWTDTPSSWTTVLSPSNAYVSNGTAPYAPWYQQTTWVYKGYLYFPGNTSGNNVTFEWHIDDAAQLLVNGSLWQGQQPTWNVKDTGVLTPGWHAIEWRGSNNGGPGGQSGGIGFGYDPTGLGNTAQLVDPGNGSLLVTSTGAGVLPTTTPVIMSSNTTFDLGGGFVSIGSLSERRARRHDRPAGAAGRGAAHHRQRQHQYHFLGRDFRGGQPRQGRLGGLHLRGRGQLHWPDDHQRRHLAGRQRRQRGLDRRHQRDFDRRQFHVDFQPFGHPGHRRRHQWRR